MVTEAEFEVISLGAKGDYPEARPRIISDNGRQFIAKDFNEFIRISGMAHAHTSPFTRNRTERPTGGATR